MSIGFYKFGLEFGGLAQSIAGIPDNATRNKAMLSWIENAGQLVNDPDAATASAKANVDFIARFCIVFSMSLATAMRQGEIKNNQANIGVIARACHVAAKLASGDATITKSSRVTIAEEAAGVVKTIGTATDIPRYKSSVLLDMAGTLRQACIKLPDTDLGDLVGFENWMSVIKALNGKIIGHDTESTVAEIREMKKYLRSKPDDETISKDELEKLVPAKRTRVEQVIALERAALASSGFSVLLDAVIKRAR